MLAGGWEWDFWSRISEASTVSPFNQKAAIRSILYFIHLPTSPYDLPHIPYHCSPGDFFCQASGVQALDWQDEFFYQQAKNICRVVDRYIYIYFICIYIIYLHIYIYIYIYFALEATSSKILPRFFLIDPTHLSDQVGFVGHPSRLVCQVACKVGKVSHATCNLYPEDPVSRCFQWEGRRTPDAWVGLDWAHGETR